MVATHQSGSIGSNTCLRGGRDKVDAAITNECHQKCVACFTQAMRDLYTGGGRGRNIIFNPYDVWLT